MPSLFYDSTYLIFTIPALIFALYAQWRVSSVYKKYSQTPNAQALTGLEVARVLMRNEGLSHVTVGQIPGMLTDHYDPRSHAMRLSAGSAQTPSLAALAVVAHELGHAQQHKEGYFWLTLRSGIVGIANIGSQLGTILFFVGLLVSSMTRTGGMTIAIVGIALMSIAVVFTLVTLPVEFDASARARVMLQRNGLMSPTEMAGVNAMLNAAALTYVAGAAQAVMQLLYFISLLSGMNRRR